MIVSGLEIINSESFMALFSFRKLSLNEYALNPAFFKFCNSFLESQFVVKSNKIAVDNCSKLNFFLKSHSILTKSGETKIVFIFVSLQIYLKASCPRVLYKVTVVIESI